MIRLLLVLVTVLPVAAAATGQTPLETGHPGSEKAHQRVPKEIAFQNDSQWEDNRWQQTDVGPFLAATITSGKTSALKGLAVRVGENGEAAVCYDTARMRLSAAWTGGFLQFEARRFGLIRPPAAAGELFCWTGKLAGWAKAGRFEPAQDEITIPEIDVSYGKRGTSETRLPKDWTWYRGHYTSGSRVVLSYTVAKTEVLESPWSVRSGKYEAFIRSLEIGPSTQSHRMMITDSGNQIEVIGDGGCQVEKTGRRSVLVIPPHEDAVRVKVLIIGKGVDEKSIALLREKAGPPENLSETIMDDSGRFSEELVTEGETTEVPATDGSNPYVIDTITLPFENPWKALFFTAGHDFFSDGSAAICTVHGDVWTVHGIDRTLGRLTWRRYATGLHQPLGLKIVGDKVYVIGRNQVTRLHDRNSDGEADFYENFNNDLIISPRSHDYVACLDTDPQGNFYFIHAKTGVMKLSADGSELTAVADGFRNPNGMGVSPDGTITAAPQQGAWTPESSLIVVKNDAYYGFGGPRVTEQRPTGWDLPMCFIPRAMDNSGGGQVWVQGDRWGPLSGKMLHLSYGQCRILMALTETVDGETQGGTIRFPTAPNDFESGVMRGRFSPHDGQLYVSGLRGWQTRAIRDGCFQRVRYSGGPVHLPVAVKTYSNGIKLTFTEPLDKSFTQRPENYFAQQWNYLWSKEYGSPDFSVEYPKQQGRDEVAIVSATSIDDGRSIFLEMPNRRPVNQVQISWLLRSEAGTPFRGEFAHTINVQPSETFPDSEIVRQARPRFVTEEVEFRLKPGLESVFQSSETRHTDRRVTRLVAMHQSMDVPPTPFLPDGPFGLEIHGTLKAPLSGYYQFKIEGNGQSELSINDELILDAAQATSTEQPILLFKGHNRIQISYESPERGHADLKLLWKGYDFDWEPVPPNVFFHDSGSPDLLAAQSRRHGRELFADRHCSACHVTDVGRDAMFELSLDPPDLSSAGERFNSKWLQQWILSPDSLRPGTSMPAVLGDGPHVAKDAADLSAFLLRGASDQKTATPTKQVRDRGETLYEQQACLSCHHFEPPDEKDEFDRRSMYHVGEKYRGGAIATFIQNPGRHHVATRMPDFSFTAEQARALAAYVRSESKGLLQDRDRIGDPQRGRVLFRDKGCQQCHALGGDARPEQLERLPASLSLKRPTADGGCLAIADDRKLGPATPRYRFSDFQRDALREFVKTDRSSLNLSHDAETSQRLYARLQCANCHDRDGGQSHRRLVVAEEGSGTLPESIPQLTWSGEKLRPAWTQTLLAGKLNYRSRPWLKAKMPSFPAYAERLAYGLAAEHGVDPHGIDRDGAAAPKVDSSLVKIGEALTLQTGLDCRQCHGIGDQQPRGDKDTAIAIGINFTHIRDRMRHDAYKRFMLDPPRYDVKTRMIRLSTNGLTTKLKTYFDADARKQFDAVWSYIQSLPAERQPAEPSGPDFAE